MDAETAPTGPVTISREMFDFLMGAGGIEGLHFGEHQPDAIGAFWWRRLLRDADTGVPSNVLLGRIEAAIEPIRHWYDTVDHQPRPVVDVLADMVFDIKADRQLLTSMRAALLAQDAAEACRDNCLECGGEGKWEDCAPCSEKFDHAVDLRRRAFDAVEGDAKRYLAMLELAEAAE